MKKNLWKFNLVLVCLLLSMIVGCSSDTIQKETAPAQTGEVAQEESDKESAEDDKEGENTGIDKLVVTYVTSPLNVPSILDKNLGIIKETYPGVEIEYPEITSGADQTLALASGDVDILHCVGGTSVISAAAAGNDIKIINTYARGPGAYTMYTSDTSLNSPESLKGKTIAGPMGTNLHELLVAYLGTSNMDISEVNYMNMKIPEAFAALEAGSIDVAMLGGAAATKAHNAGYHKIADGAGYIEGITCVATSQAYYDAHKEVIDKFIEAQEKMRNYMKENPDKAREIATKELGISDEDYDYMLPNYNFSIEVTEQDIKGMQSTADFMLNSGMIENEVKAEDLYLIRK